MLKKELVQFYNGWEFLAKVFGTRMMETDGNCERKAKHHLLVQLDIQFIKNT